MSCFNLLVSKKLEDFLNFQTEAIKMYTYCYEKVNDCDKLKCDLLHKIELEYYEDKNEERRLQTQLKYCLKDRRYYKDRVEELLPFVNLFLSEEKNREAAVKSCITVINHLKQSLGEVRKIENYHANRVYKPRILKDGFGEK